MARQRRAWPRRLLAWFQHGSDPSVAELRATIAARVPRQTEALPHQAPETARPPVAVPPTQTTWDSLVAQTKTDEDMAWWEAWNALARIPNDERSKEDWQALAALLEERAEWMAVVAEIPAGDADLRESSAFYWEGAVARSEHMELLLQWSQLRQEEIALRAHHGDHSTALNLLLDMWETWQSVPHGETRDMMHSFVAAQIAWLGLGPAVIAPEQVRRLVDALGEADFQQSLANSLAYDAHVYLEAFPESWKRACRERGLEGRIYATFFLRQDEAAYAQLMTRLIHAAEAPYYAALDEIEAVEQILEGFRWTRIITVMSVHHAVVQSSHAAQRQAGVELARLGLLIELHHAEHGMYPERLSVLAPELGGAVPVDPFTGQPYRYRPEEDGFTLYSLGPNMQDNGGRHALSDGDIVWRGVAQLPLQSIVHPPEMTVSLD